MRDLPDSPLPYGPYAAACLAAGHVFLRSRASVAPVLVSQGYSLRTLGAAEEYMDEDGEWVPPRSLDIVLGGCGAVGSTWLHALWASPGLTGQVTIADSDPEGVTLTNLNRCPLFARADIGLPKAQAAEARTKGMALKVTPRHERLEVVGVGTGLTLSAVDTNAARQAIQALYPARLLQGATNELRAEVLRCDPTSTAACIRCFCPPEADVSDTDRRRDFLQLPRAEQEREAAEAGISIEEASTWAVTGQCGYAGERLVEHLRASDRGPEAFAVGFVSVMAGTMLAAQTVREAAGLQDPFDGLRCRAKVTFMDPTAMTNQVSAYGRDPACPSCVHGSVRHTIWRKRYEQAVGPRASLQRIVATVVEEDRDAMTLLEAHDHATTTGADAAPQ